MFARKIVHWRGGKNRTPEVLLGVELLTHRSDQSGINHKVFQPTTREGLTDPGSASTATLRSAHWCSLLCTVLALGLLVSPAAGAHSGQARSATSRLADYEGAIIQVGQPFSHSGRGIGSGAFDDTNSGSTRVDEDSQVESPHVKVSPTSINFGNVKVGTKGTRPVTITNTGTTKIKIIRATVTGRGFSISGLALPLTLNPGRYKTFNAIFAPRVTGKVNGGIYILSNAQSSPLIVSLFGTGVSGTTLLLSLSPTSTHFGNVKVGNKSSSPVELINIGTGSVTVTQANLTGRAFSISGLSLPLTIPAGKNSYFNVTFAPTGTGVFNGNVSIVSNAQNSPANEPLTGTGVTGTTLLLSLSPTSTNFGNVVVNTPSTLPVEMINTGTGSVTITQAILTGKAFSISGLSLPLTIPAGKNSSFSVTFDPTTTGVFNGNVSIVSNAQNSPANEPLSGTGINDPWVGLSWTASTSHNVVGYNMYRGTQPNGPFTKINTSLINGTSYQDNSVYAGYTYYYAATAVNSQGVESPYSNIAEATIPTSPGNGTGSGK